MGYPLDDTFVTAPVAGYTTTLRGMSASYNSAQQAIDISASSSQSILRFNEPAHGDFWFEADVELLSDPDGRRCIGLWMMTGNGAEGYRLAHVGGAWVASSWSSSFGTGTDVTAPINAGATLAPGVVAPSVSVGQRMILRCDVITGHPKANGMPDIRLIQFKVDGVPIFLITDNTYPGKLIPGVFLYGATARVHAIAGDTPSSLPAFPTTVGANAGCGLRHGNRPLHDLWDRGGTYDGQLRPLLDRRHNIYFNGRGFIEGTVKERGTPDRPLERQVLLYHESTRLLVDAAWSKADGRYRFDDIDPTQRYTVVSYDHEHLYRAVVADNIKPETTT